MGAQLTEQEKCLIPHLYSEGKSTKELAKQFGRARSTISKIIKESGMEIRDQYESLALSESWWKRKAEKRFGVNVRTETPEQSRKREIKRMANKKLTTGYSKTSDLPLFAAGIKVRERNRARETFREKYNQDPQFRLKEIYRRRFKKIVGGGYSQTMTTLLECNTAELRDWIEGQWEGWMSWENYGPIKEGYWQIDHVVPCSWFDHSNEEQLRLCWNYQNLRPIPSLRNQRLRDSGTEIFSHFNSIPTTDMVMSLLRFAIKSLNE